MTINMSMQYVSILQTYHYVIVLLFHSTFDTLDHCDTGTIIAAFTSFAGLANVTIFHICQSVPMFLIVSTAEVFHSFLWHILVFNE